MGKELVTDILIAAPSLLGCVLFVVFYRSLDDKESEAHPIYRQSLSTPPPPEPSPYREENSARAGAA